ncbi:MAG: hypothetical protein AAF438_10480 [Pseudomonadota bacterium]
MRDKVPVNVEVSAPAAQLGRYAAWPSEETRMRMLAFMLVVASSFPQLAHAQESTCLSDPPTVRELVKHYSDRTGTKFVLNPRVSGSVDLMGIDVENIDYPTLVGVFNVHALSAVELEGVIYVMPEPMVPLFIERAKNSSE